MRDKKYNVPLCEVLNIQASKVLLVSDPDSLEDPFNNNAPQRNPLYV